MLYAGCFRLSLGKPVPSLPGLNPRHCWFQCLKPPIIQNLMSQDYLHHHVQSCNPFVDFIQFLNFKDKYMGPPYPVKLESMHSFSMMESQGCLFKDPDHQRSCWKRRILRTWVTERAGVISGSFHSTSTYRAPSGARLPPRGGVT